MVIWRGTYYGDVVRHRLVGFVDDIVQKGEAAGSANLDSVLAIGRNSDPVGMLGLC